MAPPLGTSTVLYRTHMCPHALRCRYTKMTESSKAYIITQYGLSCFEATGPGAYEARTFNFYLFPQPHGGYNRRFLCDASSLVFLASHGRGCDHCSVWQGVWHLHLRVVPGCATFGCALCGSKHMRTRMQPHHVCNLRICSAAAQDRSSHACQNRLLN
jgi:hypothetical protein